MVLCLPLYEIEWKAHVLHSLQNLLYFFWKQTIGVPLLGAWEKDYRWTKYNPFSDSSSFMFFKPCFVLNVCFPTYLHGGLGVLNLMEKIALFPIYQFFSRCDGIVGEG